MVDGLTSNVSWHIKLILGNSMSKEVIRLALINSRYLWNTLFIHGLPYLPSVQYDPLTVALLRLDFTLVIVEASKLWFIILLHCYLLLEWDDSISSFIML